MIFFALLAIALTLGYVFVKWRYTYWQRLGVPCPQPSFFVGNVGSTLTMTSHLALLCEQWYRDYSNYAYSGYYKILTPAINLRDPDLIKDVLIKDHFHFHVNEQYFSKRFDTLMAYNPFVATNDTWRRARSILTPLLTLYKIRSLHPLIVDSCDKLVGYLKKQPPNKDLEAKTLAARFATQNVIRCLFSIDSKCFTDGENDFRQMGKKIFAPNTLGGLNMMMMSICPMLKDVFPFSAFVPSDVDSWFRELVNDLKENRRQNPPQHEDVFQMILKAAEKTELTETELAGYALTMFTEGYETSSSVLGFAIYQMAANPDIQERLHEEISECLARHGNQMTFEALQEMEYLECVIYETMRINVVAPMISKVCTKAYTLPLLEGQTKPVTIQPGTPVQIAARAIHMDPQYYPDPEVFDPLRFTEDERRKRHKALYLPFGEGPRMCTGVKFAMAQTKAGLLSIVRDFKITLSPNHKPFVFDVRTFLLQARDGLKVNLTPRYVSPPPLSTQRG